MQRAGIFLFLSQKESERLPNVLKEALYNGCGLVAARSPDIADLVKDESMGSIVDATDDAAIDAAIAAALAEDDAIARRRRERGRRIVETEFSTTAGMASYVEVWREALARR
jgi:glycosyltransferase involved in cell wall biosynthesis